MKQTEIGLIPDDWEVKRLGDLVEISSGTTPSRYDYNNFTGTICWLTSGELKNHYIYDTNEKISEKAAYRMRCYPKGTVVIAMYGLEAVGVRGTCSILAVASTISQACMAFSNFQQISNDFFYYWYSYNGESIGIKFAQGTKQQNLSPEIVKEFLISLPPLPEQQRIAKALSDVDTLISTTEKLIQKKKNIKLGTMQNLLTGKKRLPGFGPQTKSPSYKQTELGPISEDWEVKNINKECTIKARIGWQGLKSTEYLDSGDYILITGTDFDSGFINWKSCSYVSKWRFDQDKNIQIKQGDVLITKDGTIGKVAFLNEIPMQGTLNSGVFVIRPKNPGKIDTVFLSLIFKSFWFDAFLEQITSGSTIVHLYQKDFVKFNFPLPSKEEQTAIANVLSSMDKEIETLNTKLEKYRNLKTAMMQQLLTGKIRLK